MGTASQTKRNLTVLLQVRVNKRAAVLLRKRARTALRTQASYLRALLYRDLGLLEAGE